MMLLHHPAGAAATVGDQTIDLGYGTAGVSQTFHQPLHIQDGWYKVTKVVESPIPVGLKVTLPFAVNGVFRTTLATPVFVDGSAQQTVPGALRYFADVTLKCTDGGCKPYNQEETFRITLVARFSCQDDPAFCGETANKELCVIDESTEYHLHWPVPAFSDDVSEALTKVIVTHYQAIKEYQLPVSILWELVGLGAVFDPPQPCCTCSTTAPTCEPPIVFTRNAARPNVATFQWARQTSPSTISSKTNPVADIKVDLPSRMSGWILVGASYVDVFFNTQDQSFKLRIVSHLAVGTSPPETLLFDQHPQCVSASRAVATVRSSSYAPALPNMHMTIGGP